MPTEHAWIETAGGTIIDVTPAYCGADGSVFTYFPAFRWDEETIRSYFVGCGEVIFPLWHSMGDDSNNRHARDVEDRAWQHTKALTERPD